MNFQTLYTYSEQIDENDFFIQHFNPNALFRHDSNFFELLYSPSIEEFKLIEDMHIQFSNDYSLSHVKFVWPQDQGILPYTLDYLSQENYGLEKLELFSVHPSMYEGKRNEDVEVRVVDHFDLSLFKTINYTEDLEISKTFADEKQPFYDEIFEDPAVTFRLAFLDNKPAGSCISIEQQTTIEIDDLFTLPEFRNRKIAGTLQAAVMSSAIDAEKQVILAADAEDTPRTMYLNQGYTYEGFRIGAVKRI